MKAILVLVVALVSNLASAEVTEIGREGLRIAELMRHGVVTNCLNEIEQKHAAQLSIGRIIQTEFPDLTTYTIHGTLIQGGDIAMGSVTVQISGSYMFPWGFAYQCEVLSENVVN